MCCSKLAQVLSLMHNGKNEILLEKISLSVSYVFYTYSLRRTYDNELSDLSLMGFNS